MDFCECRGGLWWCIFVDCVSSLCVGLILDLILQFVSVQLQLLLRYSWSPAPFKSHGITVQEVQTGLSRVKSTYLV